MGSQLLLGTEMPSADDPNVLKLDRGGGTKRHSIVHFKMVHFILCEFH